MINLLPPEEKIALKQRELKQKTLMITGCIVFFFVLLGATIFSISLLINQKTANLKLEYQKQVKLLASPDFLSFKETVINTNQKLAEIKTFYQKQIYFASLLENLAELTPPSIYFTNVSFKKIYVPEDKKKKNPERYIVEVRIAGKAKTREDLLSFKKQLEKQGDFKEIYLSPSSWIEPEKTGFSLMFKFDPYGG